MSKKQKKKRNKKYRPPEDEQPQIHRYVAEVEEKKTSRTKLKRWAILGLVLAAVIFILLKILGM